MEDRLEYRRSILDLRSAILHPRSPILSAVHRHSSGSNTGEADLRLAPVTPSPSGIKELDAVYGPLAAAQIIRVSPPPLVAVIIPRSSIVTAMISLRRRRGSKRRRHRKREGAC